MWSARRQAAGLLALGVVGGLATLFGPAAGSGGVDIGAIGAAVFGLTLIAAIVLLARRADEVFPEDASVAERRAWIGLLYIGFVLLSFVRFMWALSHSIEPPTTFNALYVRFFVQHLIVLTIARELMSFEIGRHAGKIQLDERDLRLRHSADRAGDWVLTVIIISCVCMLAILPASLFAWWLAPVVLANLLIGLLIVRSLVEHVVLAIAYFAARR